MIPFLIATVFAALPEAAQRGLEALVADLEQDRVTVDSEQVRALHRRACGAGYAPSCEPSWAPGDLRGAAAALSPVCEAGDPVACTVVGWAAIQVEPGKVDPELRQLDAALAHFRSACAAGVERACVDEGVLLLRGAEGPEGMKRAEALFLTACQMGELSGCRRLGAMYHNGRGVGRDIHKARAYYQQACEGGLALGCNGLALLDHLGIGTPKRPLRAEANYVRACDAGLVSACANLEKLYRGGVDPDRDPASAMALWESGCERGVAVACANGGRLADDPRMGERSDPARARMLLTRGCATGDPFTCGLLGVRLLDDEPERGEELLEAACDAGIATSCQDLADALWKGKRLRKDRRRARKLYARACSGGAETACSRAR